MTKEKGTKNVERKERLKWRTIMKEMGEAKRECKRDGQRERQIDRDRDNESEIGIEGMRGRKKLIKISISKTAFSLKSNTDKRDTFFAFFLIRLFIRLFSLFA